MSRLRVTVALCSVVLLVAAAYVGWSVISSYVPKLSPSEPPRTLEAAGDLAMQRAANHPEVDFVPYRASDAVLELPYFPNQDYRAFGDHFFVYVWSELGHIENSPFAVNEQGTAYKLPEEFDQLVRGEGLQLASQQEAHILLEFYLELTLAMPSADRVDLLTGIHDIPGVDGRHIDRHHDEVDPLDAIPHDSGWMLEFYTWYLAGGGLHRWKVNVDFDGVIRVLERELLAIGIGDHVTIE